MNKLFKNPWAWATTVAAGLATLVALLSDAGTMLKFLPWPTRDEVGIMGERTSHLEAVTNANESRNIDRALGIVDVMIQDAKARLAEAERSDPTDPNVFSRRSRLMSLLDSLNDQKAQLACERAAMRGFPRC